MKLVADENLDRSVIQKLREAGHEVISVAEMEPGISDELVFRRSLVHQGVILLRLAGLPVAAKAELLVATIATHERELNGAFAVVTPRAIRIRRSGPGSED